MLLCDRINISEETSSAKSNTSKERMVCHCWFCNYGFEFQGSVCNGCHNFTILCLNASDIAIITVKDVNYCCIAYVISKYDAIHLLESSVLGACGYL